VNEPWRFLEFARGVRHARMSTMAAIEAASSSTQLVWSGMRLLFCGRSPLCQILETVAERSDREEGRSDPVAHQV